MDARDKLTQRVDLFTAVVRGSGKVERTPHFFNFHTWLITDAGYQLSEALRNNDVMVEVIRRSAQRYEYDTPFWTGHRNPVLVEQALGKFNYVIDDERGTINVTDICVLEADEYDDLKDMRRYRWEKVLPRLAPGLAGTDNANKYRESLREFGAYRQMQANVANVLRNEFGIPLKSDLCWGSAGIEELFSFYRGIKGLSIDLRRQFDKVREGAELLTSYMTKYYTQDPPESFRGRSDHSAFDMHFTMLAHTILNAKQFEKLYQPYLKRVGDIAQRYDKTCFIFGEGMHKRFYDFYRDLPANRFCLLPEQDDIFEFARELPNVIPCGGMPVTLLASGSVQENLDYARKLIEEVRPDGRYVFAADKMVSFPADAKLENVKAVTDFVASYRR